MMEQAGVGERVEERARQLASRVDLVGAARISGASSRAASRGEGDEDKGGDMGKADMDAALKCLRECPESAGRSQSTAQWRLDQTKERL